MTIFRTMIVPASDVEVARLIGASFGPAGEGMWTTALSPNAEEPATHYVSTGHVPPEFAHLVPCQNWMFVDGKWVLMGESMGNPDAVYEVAKEVVTREQVDALFQSADVTDQDPYVAFERLGVQLVKHDDLL